MVKDKVIFIDSDGTVIDSMNLKHFNAFGPAFIDTFGLEEYKEDIQKEWNRINLFSLTRGINRFEGLYQIMSYVNLHFKRIDILEDYKTWLDKTTKKSNSSLDEYIKEEKVTSLRIVLDWSLETNRRIALNHDNVKPFKEVKKVLEMLAKEFIIIIISSANHEAVMDEWTKFDLIGYVDEVCTQEMGTKDACILKMVDKIKPSDALMIGDALSDLKAAESNEIPFYPIIPNHENESWINFMNKYKDMFNKGNYRAIEQDIIDNFKEELSKGV